MIALYNLDKRLEEMLSYYLKEEGEKVAYFYSMKSILDQVINPMVVITTASFVSEVDSLSVPVVPITIHMTDVEQAVCQLVSNGHLVEEVIIIASEKEMKWLKMEQHIRMQLGVASNFSYQFVNLEDMKHQAAQLKVKEDRFLFVTPQWTKQVKLTPYIKNVCAVSPSMETILSAARQASFLSGYTREMTREKLQIQAVVNSAHDGVIAVDKEGYITLVNEHAKNLLSLPEEALHRKITDFIPHSDMMRVLQTGKKEIGDLATVLDKQIVINRFPVVIHDTVVGAVSNFKEITDIQKLEMKLRRKLHHSGLEARYCLTDIVGHSEAISEVREQAKLFGETGATVLITGESGTGKELFAQGIHLASGRSVGPFVAINCAALPESLLESELFGYEDGAFTGAKKGGKQGLFELAHGGTLFLDEIGEMPLRIQALLLRVLQEKCVRRIGGERIIPVDVRIIAATNKNLEEAIEHKQFRPDLYYRINLLTLELPPLRKRLEDIPLLVMSIVNQLNEQREKKIEGVDDQIYRVFMQYHWPGNVRELRNVVERMVLLAKGRSLTLKDVDFFRKKIGKDQTVSDHGQEKSLKQTERDLILATLNKYQYNKSLVAKSLGIDRSTLWRKMKEYHLSDG
ncbi:sigma 54-interacting transcriptional regulator [Microaerobacter geothermalis]|uniref:sigma-54 interaction domain-containing protein n=1 Tax=Microaerobacter geothermalis TaxID=674972 RepID=UPI001F18F04C|nr:sigma 54-interacting transcriptional regulator [Microaerobacter geothermalis]MCF6094218.1 sigma 54-interacting transcriptional regulator [Microaerobacter geothermalis]